MTKLEILCRLNQIWGMLFYLQSNLKSGENITVVIGSVNSLIASIELELSEENNQL